MNQFNPELKDKWTLTYDGPAGNMAMAASRLTSTFQLTVEEVIASDGNALLTARAAMRQGILDRAREDGMVVDPDSFHETVEIVLTAKAWPKVAGVTIVERP